jgi:hypothetical protein
MKMIRGFLCVRYAITSRAVEALMIFEVGYHHKKIYGDLEFPYTGLTPHVTF